jgi:hypothetical protein
VNNSNGNRIPPDNKKDTPASSTGADSERRRMGRIVHDDRGSASVEWWNAPDDYERPVFRIEGTGVKEPLSIQNDDTFNPYDRSPDTASTLGGKPSAQKGGKRDLKKLSEWLKLMRELEERKKRGDE